VANDKLTWLEDQGFRGIERRIRTAFLKGDVEKLEQYEDALATLQQASAKSLALLYDEGNARR
jgi:hypothetical protein